MCVDVGFPGRMADAKVLRFTPLYRKAMQWFGNKGYYIYGDAAYPLRLVCAIYNVMMATPLVIAAHISCFTEPALASLFQTLADDGIPHRHLH